MPRRIHIWQDDGSLDDSTSSFLSIDKYEQLRILEDEDSALWDNYLRANEELRRVRQIVIDSLTPPRPLTEQEKALFWAEQARWEDE